LIASFAKLPRRIMKGFAQAVLAILNLLNLRPPVLAHRAEPTWRSLFLAHRLNTPWTGHVSRSFSNRQATVFFWPTYWSHDNCLGGTSKFRDVLLRWKLQCDITYTQQKCNPMNIANSVEAWIRVRKTICSREKKLTKIFEEVIWRRNFKKEFEERNWKRYLKKKLKEDVCKVRLPLFIFNHTCSLKISTAILFIDAIIIIDMSKYLFWLVF